MVDNKPFVDDAPLVAGATVAVIADRSGEPALLLRRHAKEEIIPLAADDVRRIIKALVRLRSTE